MSEQNEATATPTAIELRKQQALAALPEHLREFYGQNLGMETFDKDHLIPPRIVLCQDNTPQRKKTEELYIEGLEEGQFFNNISEEILGDKFRFIPLFTKALYLEMIPRDEGGGVRNRYDNKKDVPKGHLDFGKGKKPVVTEIISVIALVESPDDQSLTLAAIPFKSTSMKVFEAWQSKMSTGKNSELPLFVRFHKLSVNTKSGKGNTWFVPAIAGDELLDAETFAYARGQYEHFKDAVIDIEGAANDTDNSNANEGDSIPF